MRTALLKSFTPINDHALADRQEADRHGCDGCTLSGKAGRTVYQGHAGPGGSGDPAWLYPWMPFLPGRNALPSDP